MKPSANRAAYDILYDEVQLWLADYAAALAPVERRWFQEWLRYCDGELRSWESRPHMSAYLRRADACHSRSLGVIAFTYLHTAYDLSRVVADGLRHCAPVPRERCREILMDAGPSVVRVFERVSGRPEVFGRFAWMIRALPGGVGAARSLSSWFMAHRTSALVAADLLADAPDRREREEYLWQHLDAASERIFHSRNPFYWMRNLPLALDLVTAAPSVTDSDTLPTLKSR